jgi:hypothetical protein
MAATDEDPVLHAEWTAVRVAAFDQAMWLPAFAARTASHRPKIAVVAHHPNDDPP